MANTEYFEKEIANLKRRIKNIEERPDPRYMKTTKLRYELEVEHLVDMVEAMQDNKPFGEFYEIGQLQSALGFRHGVGGDRVRDPYHYKNIAVNTFGFPEHTCDRTMMAMALLVSGELPIPRVMTTHRTPCDPHRLSYLAAAEFLGVLLFELVKPNSSGEAAIRCFGEQLGELVEFCEKSVAGIKYDEDKLIEILETNHIARGYQIETYELRKRVPCPISPQDVFRIALSPGGHVNPAKALEYCRLYRDELFERAEKGITGVPDEKLRIAWTASAPFGRQTFDLLTRKGVSMPWYHFGVSPAMYGVIPATYGDDSAYGRKLTPLEEVARGGIFANVWGTTAEPWVDSLIKACRELKIDAVVDYLMPGCITTKSLKRITSERLMEELGIPTLDLEGREFFMTEGEIFNMNKKLEEFIDMCIANKK
ncbi:MAG: 2-hydroxyacyl-CoA dehydratase [Dehalococcoidales bacterium]|nr:2-hydroxyacyl-CoA dehydratase [Dehalococcoidales bacterium]